MSQVSCQSRGHAPSPPLLLQLSKPGVSGRHGASVQRQGGQEASRCVVCKLRPLADFCAASPSDLSRRLLPSGDHGSEGLLPQRGQRLPGADESAADPSELMQTHLHPPAPPPTCGTPTHLCHLCLQDHLNVCPFFEVPCPLGKCKERMMRKEIPEHLAWKCKYRESTCEFCKNKMPLTELQVRQSADSGLTRSDF